jgi:hypothetical protein
MLRETPGSVARCNLLSSREESEKQYDGKKETQKNPLEQVWRQKRQQ